MDLQHVLLATFERAPGRLALVGDTERTYAELADESLRLASAFESMGVRRGDRVATMVPNGAAYVVTHIATQLIGACAVPLNTRYSQDEATYCLSDSDPTIVIAAEEHLDTVDVARAEYDGRFAVVSSHATGKGAQLALQEMIDGSTPASLSRVHDSDPSVLLYTSGTTGRPKGVLRTHSMEFSASISMAHQTRWTPEDSTLGVMPNYHTMGLHAMLSMILFGGTYAPMASFGVDEAIDYVADNALTTACLIPTLYWRLVHSPRAAEGLRSLNKLMVGGAPLTSELALRIREVIDPEVFVNWYGCTEIFSFSVEENPSARPGSVGHPTLLSRLRVVDPDTEAHRSSPDDLVAAGEIGQVIVAAERQDDAFTGYLNRPEADEKALRGGWYFTGDLGRVDEDGRYWLVGRGDDVIITGGENVYATEVEDALEHCPGVSEIVVCGLPHDEWGQVVTAFVVLEDPSDHLAGAENMLSWVRAHSRLSGFKRPKRVIVVDAIPKSAIGKVLRRKLVAGHYTALADVTRTPNPV